MCIFLKWTLNPYCLYNTLYYYCIQKPYLLLGPQKTQLKRKINNIERNSQTLVKQVLHCNSPFECYLI